MCNWVNRVAHYELNTYWYREVGLKKQSSRSKEGVLRMYVRTASLLDRTEAIDRVSVKTKFQD